MMPESNIKRALFDEFKRRLKPQKVLILLGATRAGRATQDFTVDHLPNWFVRLSRRRFWKQGNEGTDKLSAYQTRADALKF
jgi:isoleucyl-tRNA synthetase